MPQASDAQRNRMEERFGDAVGDEGPIRFLQSRGYKLQSWEWLIPDGHTPTKDEIECVVFLIDEWDFGGFARKDPT